MSVKDNALVKQQATFVVDESTTSLKVGVLLEENSACKNICTNILNMKVIQVSVKTFLWYNCQDWQLQPY